MNISMRLTVAILGLGALILVLSLLAVVPLERRLKDIGEFHTPAILKLQEIESHVQRAIQESFAYALGGGRQQIEEFREALGVVDEAATPYRIIAEMHDTEERAEAAIFDRILAEREEIEIAAEAMFAELEQHGVVFPETAARYELLADRIQADLDRLMAVEQSEVELAHALARTTISRAERALYGIGLISILCAIGVGFVVSRTVSGPITRLTAAVSRMDRGTPKQVAIEGAGEITVLAEAFNSMAASVAERTGQLQEMNTALRASEARYQDLYDQAPDLFITLDARTRSIVECNLTASRTLGYAREEIVGMLLLDLVHEDSLPQAREVFDAILETGAARDAVLTLKKSDGRRFHASLNATTVHDEDGSAMTIRSTWRDISDRLDAERQQRVLLRELDHRVKNNLASVLALSNLSMEAATSFDDFRRSFTGRLQAMARTHEALAEARWMEVTLGETVQVSLRPFLEGIDGRVTVTGDPVQLSARVASSLGLAFHELATNAAKYGALSSSRGRIEIKWRAGDQDAVDLEWFETDGPVVTAEAREGFGLQLLRGLIEHELGGRLSVDFRPTGLACHIMFRRSA